MGFRWAAAAGFLFVLIAGLVACSSPPRMPSGPSPEYEDPPRPSWLAEGGAAAAPASPLDMILDAPSPPPSPAAATDGGP